MKSMIVIMFVVLVPAFSLAQSDSPKPYLMPNGIELLGFDYRMFSEKAIIQDEFDFTDDQNRRIKKLKAELEKPRKPEHAPPASRNKPHNLAHTGERAKEVGSTFGTRSIHYDRISHYPRFRKILAPHQRKRLDQIFTWYGRSQGKSRFAAWVAFDVLEASKLSQDKVNQLVQIAGQEEKEYRAKLKQFHNEQSKEVFSLLTNDQKNAYLQLINPKREVIAVETADFPSWDITMSASFQMLRELRLTAEQQLAIRDINARFERKYFKSLSELTKQQQMQIDRNILRFEVYKKEFASQMEDLYTPQQLGVIEWHYINRRAAYHGPVEAIFDPAIASRVGVSMKKLRSMEKLRKKLNADAKKKRIELTRQGFESILKKVDKETRAVLKKYFGKPPEFALN